MAKIILSNNGTVLQEISLLKERVTIGRQPNNDIVIQDRAISGEHAVIVTFFNDSILEDLNSTNGIHINGQRVKRHFLQHQDVIEFAQYRLTYLVEAQPQTSMGKIFEEAKLKPEAGAVEAKVTRALTISHTNPQAAVIQILDGPNAGKLVVLDKALTTIGQPGTQIAVVAATVEGYNITHVEGMTYPVVNGASIGAETRQLMSGDVIEVSGVRLAFSLEWGGVTCR